MLRTGEEEHNGSLRFPRTQASAEASKARAVGSYRAGDTGVSCVMCGLGTSLDPLPEQYKLLTAETSLAPEYLCDI